MSEDSTRVEAIAVVGMSCRFAPDLDSLEKFWQFLAGGHSTVTEMPDKRWDPYAATSPQATSVLRGTTRKGSFLTDIEGFDADFFGITPKEAGFLDPQQRIVLELAWEALEQAGIPPLSLRGTDTGVFVAANSNDYGRRLLEDITRTGAWAVNGTTYYGIANRVSYFMDLRGPSMAVDTACAGSLTALHLAAQSLRCGESPVAIVAGVNVMATPALFVALDAAGATAPDGRSKAFDKAADGYGRGEGAGVVVLKRLRDAVSDGDEVLALVLGSGVHQDGRSDGMMAPSGEGQEHLLRETYRRAGIDPSTVDYVEAHGTGTPVGDREEAHALAKVFGPGRSAERPLLIGSVKPNIGHTEAGSGIAGMIKTVLALRHGTIPPSVHTEPNPEFDWAASGLRLADGQLPWASNGHPRRAGVSSYGVGGTTAHVILQDAPATGPDPAAEPTPAAAAATVYPLSAMSEAGARALAGRVADWLGEHPEASAASVGHTLAHRRSHLSQRVAVAARSTAELATRLRAVADGQNPPGTAIARTASGAATGVVWVFSGHGAQWSGMGRELLETEPAFAETIDALEETFRTEIGFGPRQALQDGGPWTASQSQALTFAMQVGLAAVWRRYGVTPAAVIGHSVGEIAAAVAAGVLDLQDAARFACRRAVALRRLEGRGGMALATVSFAEAERRLAGRTDVVAAITASPTSAVISGDRAAVEELTKQWRAEGVPVWRVDTDIAFHSPHVDASVDDVRAAADLLTPRPAAIPLYSTALVDPRSDALRDGRYWAGNVREPVRFTGAVQAAIEDGHRIFLEIAAHPVVKHSIEETLSGQGIDEAVVVQSSRRGTSEVDTLLASLAELFCNGAAVDWDVVHPTGRLLELPTMSWQHRPYWIFPEDGTDAATGGGHDPEQHTLLGGRMTVADTPARQVWQTHLDLTCRPYPQSHEVVGAEITPAAAIINTFVTAAEQDGRRPALADIVLRTPLAVVPPRVVQIVLAENSMRLATRIIGGDAGDENEWITHSTATVEPGWTGPRGRMDVAGIRARCTDERSWEQIDGMFRTMGVGGYAFPWDLDEFRRNDAEQFAVQRLVPEPATLSSSWAHVIDGALTISAVLVTPEDARKLWMSSHIDAVGFTGEPPARIHVHSRRNPQSPHDTVDVSIATDDGTIVGEVTGLRFAPLQDEFGAAAAPRDLVHEIVWRPLPLDGAGTAVRTAVVVGDPAGTIAAALDAAGVRCRSVADADELAEAPVDTDVVVVAPKALLPGEAPERAAERCAWTLVRTAQVLAAAGSATPPKLWVITDGVRAATAEDALGHAPLWGTARIVAGEHSELWGGTVDLNGSADRLAEVMRAAAGTEDVISIWPDGVTTARLSPIERPSDDTALQCRPNGTYLITGGLGALGLQVARWLVDRGATRIMLAGRNGLPPRDTWAQERDAAQRAQIDGVLALEALGVTVRVLAVDIADEQAVAAALDPATHGLPPVRGIVHAAGVTRDAMVANVDRQGLHEVLRPKADGAMVLHRLFPPGSLDFFVLFSSCGQFARLTGQASYAAANSFLDTLAAHRRAGGHTGTTSMGWTSWLGSGMAASIANTMLEANARGLEAVTTAEALRAWAFADRFGTPYKAVLRVLATPSTATRLPMFRELTATSTETATDQDMFVVDWDGLAEADLRELILGDVRDQVAAELNLAVEDVELRRPLIDFGVDSVMTVSLRVRLQRRYGLELPPTILWNKPTVAALAGHIVDSFRPAEAESDTQ
ncbi:type I polyketide synthase [Dactylosporangium sp. NPDC051485]|uniref:type I polyketide synthase n=1 Tax=Dactylosporangium sp. NPDC051485 TaxID=3154846 RepID=UPI003448F39D